MSDLRHDVATSGAADGLVSRRTINLGAAWSVPVVLAAVAAPAVAASTNHATFAILSAEKGEAVGPNREVTFTLNFVDIVGANAVTLTKISAGGPWVTLPTPEVIVDAGHPAAIFTLTRPDTNNSAMLDITVTYTVNGVEATTTVTVKNNVPGA
jgi:hypothetical protein